MNLDKSKPTLGICHANDWLRHAYVTQMWPMRCEGCLSGPLRKNFKGTWKRFSSGLCMLLSEDLLLQPFCAHEVTRRTSM